MSIFSRAESKKKIESLEAENIALMESVEDLKKQNEELTESLTEQKEENTELEKMVSESEEKISKHAEELETFEKRVHCKALEIVGAVSTEPVKETKSDDTTGDSSLIAQYKKLPAGQQRAKFREENPSLFN